MAVEHIQVLANEMPEIFAQRPMPEDWETEWVFYSGETPMADPFEMTGLLDSYMSAVDVRGGLPPVPVFPVVSFPGAPTRARSPLVTPPTDALAFYLPYHYFFPNWWGVYLLIEGALWFAAELVRGGVTFGEAARVARLFLYGHEVFHHRVETFSTRLELTHRRPLYRTGIEAAFVGSAGTDAWTEEAVANAYAFDFVRREYSHSADWPAINATLENFIRTSPPGYRMAAQMLTSTTLDGGENKLAEEYQNAAVPGLRTLDLEVWACFPHAFTGISRRTSRVNYLIPRNSPIIARLPLKGRLITYQKLAQKLRAHGCSPLRSGKGSHEIWSGPAGTFPIPKHRGDLVNSTVRRILREAGLNMALSDL